MPSIVTSIFVIFASVFTTFSVTATSIFSSVFPSSAVIVTVNLPSLYFASVSKVAFSWFLVTVNASALISSNFTP